MTTDRTRLAEERERAALLCEDLATMMEAGAGEHQPGDRLRQAARNIREGAKPLGLAASSTEATGEAVAWQPLLEGERAQAVAAICEYGTGFVAPLFSVIEGIERKLQERNRFAAPAPSAPADDPWKCFLAYAEKAGHFREDGSTRNPERSTAAWNAYQAAWKESRAALAAPEGVTDTQRLDALSDPRILRTLSFDKVSGRWHFDIPAGPCSINTTPREAIDAALAAQQPKEL